MRMNFNCSRFRRISIKTPVEKVAMISSIASKTRPLAKISPFYPVTKFVYFIYLIRYCPEMFFCMRLRFFIGYAETLVPIFLVCFISLIKAFCERTRHLEIQKEGYNKCNNYYTASIIQLCFPL